MTPLASILVAVALQYWTGDKQVQWDGSFERTYQEVPDIYVAFSGPPELVQNATPISPTPPAAPRIVAAWISENQREVRLTWNHPDATTFAVRCISERGAYTNGWHTAAIGHTNFTFIFKLPGLTNAFSIQAVEPSTRLVSPWSKQLTVESTQ